MFNPKALVRLAEEFFHEEIVFFAKMSRKPLTDQTLIAMALCFMYPKETDPVGPTYEWLN
jgi:hypothetical protein